MIRIFRFFMLFVIAALLTAAYFTWEPAPAGDSGEDGNETQLFNVLSSLSEKMPNLREDIQDLSGQLKRHLNSFQQADNILSATEPQKMGMGSWENVSVDQLLEYLQSVKEKISELEAAELKEKFNQLIETIAQATRQEAAEPDRD